MMYPPLSIAMLFFHPLNFDGMHKRAEAVFKHPGGRRAYGHPFTCDVAVEAQKVVDQKPQVEGEQNVLVGVQSASDKTEVERERSLDPTHMKLWNTITKLWFKRHVKTTVVLSPIFERNDDLSGQENARAHQRQWQRSFACYLVVLEACARMGIRCTHSEHGTFRLWPLCWSFMMDRAEADMCTGVNRACQGNRICPQCVTLTEQFSGHQCPACRDQMRRYLNDMLALPDTSRQAYSWLAQSADLMHGPVALAVVDPSVVHLDFGHVPPDRWHGIINNVDAITGCVRETLRKAKLTEVWWSHMQQLATLGRGSLWWHVPLAAALMVICHRS